MKITHEHTLSSYNLYSPEAKKIDDIILNNIDSLSNTAFDKLNDKLGEYESEYRTQNNITE